MVNDLRHMNTRTKSLKLMLSVGRIQSSIFFFVLCFLCSFFSFAQVTSSVETNSIKIGEQITYQINVEVDTTKLVVFPEGQTFLPLEMIDSYQIDTTKNNDNYNLIKRYGLTQFDSGSYTVPRQKVIIGDKTFFTDSLHVEVNEVVVDTTKAIYDIKPIIGVEKTASTWWKTLLYILLAIAIVGFLLYWFIWRKKPLTEEQKIALLPPYDRAKLALAKLDESSYLENENLKDYYSELTFIIRKYLDEKVYDRALESTTDELITRLKILKEGNQVDLSKDDITNIESILKRADLVKFAKSAPDVELAKIDRSTIDIEIDHVKEALPEPTEEEKLLDEKYKAEQERKKKRNKIILTVALSLCLIAATIIGFSIKYGFGYVKDTIIGHETKELLEGDWVTSEYGIPPIKISTPRVLKREVVKLPDSSKTKEAPKVSKFDAFYYGSMLSKFYILVRSVPAKQEELIAGLLKNNPTQAEAVSKMDESEAKKVILSLLSEELIKTFKSQGAENILVKKEDYDAPLFSGVKTSGSFTGKNAITDAKMNFEYQIYLMAENDAIQGVVFTYQKDDAYAIPIINRVVNSIDLNNEENEEE